jgi:hypothetical protein
MTLQLDERALKAVVRRRGRGREAGIVLRVEHASLHAGAPPVLAVHWTTARRVEAALLLLDLDDVAVWVEERVARYTEARDVTISATRLGPFEWLRLDDPFAMEHLEEWEQRHGTVSKAVPIEGVRNASSGG